MNDRIDSPKDHKVEVHEQSYPDSSLVIELRPPSHENSWEKDMTRLSEEDARQLKQKLEQVLDDE